jgi:hypothetical protein
MPSGLEGVKGGGRETSYMWFSALVQSEVRSGAIMPKSYLAPELLSYGSVAGITSIGFVKCTPHPDSGGFGHTHAKPEDVILDPDAHDDNCLPKNQMSP